MRELVTQDGNLREKYKMKTINLFNKHKRKGIALVWGTLFLMVLLGVMAIMLDFAWGYLAVHQIQNAVDSAALAGSRYTPIVHDPNSGISNVGIAKNIAHAYGIDHVSAGVDVFLDTSTAIDTTLADPINPYDPAITDDIIIGRYVEHSGLFYVDHINPDSMMVIGRRDGTSNQPLLGLTFGPVFGQDSATYKRFAVAKVLDAYGAGVLALGECDCSGIYFGGSGAADDLTILNGGSLYVNASYNPGGADGAIDQTGNSDPDLLVDNVFAVGGIDSRFDWPEGSNIYDHEDGVQPQPDPYAYLPDHIADSPGSPGHYKTTPDKGTIADANDPMVYSPGYYSGGIQITSSDVHLQPGDYYLDSVGQDASMTVNGGLITGEGVTLHIVGDADVGIDIQGNANIDITAPDNGTYAGVAIYQKRDEDYDCTISCVDWPNSYPLSELNGTGDLVIDGAVYMPHNKLTLGGTGYIELTRVVADRFYIYGNGEKIVNYRGIRKIAPKSYLVK